LPDHIHDERARYSRQSSAILVVTEIAEAEKISKSYVSRILRLALLAPDIVEAILGGCADQQEMLEKLERPLPVSWEEQRAAFSPRHAQIQGSNAFDGLEQSDTE
jgi:hypothetical protein